MVRRAAHGRYVLGPDGHPVPCADLLEWGRWFESADRVVRQDEVNGFLVSTVFLGLDHSFSGGPPVLWETMVLGADGHPLDELQLRYTSREEAESGHAGVLSQCLAMN